MGRQRTPARLPDTYIVKMPSLNDFEMGRNESGLAGATRERMVASRGGGQPRIGPLSPSSAPIPPRTS